MPILVTIIIKNCQMAHLVTKGESYIFSTLKTNLTIKKKHAKKRNFSVCLQFWTFIEQWQFFYFQKKIKDYVYIWIFLVYLVRFRVQKKCNLKVSYFQTFRLRLESSSLRIYFYYFIK